MPLQIKRIDREVGGLLEHAVVSNVAAGGCFKVISTNDINAMLGLERMRDALNCTDTTCAAEIGGALGVELLLSGTVDGTRARSLSASAGIGAAVAFVYFIGVGLLERLLGKRDAQTGFPDLNTGDVRLAKYFPKENFDLSGVE